MTSKIFVNYRRKQEGGWAAESISTRLVAEFGADRVFLDVKGIPPSANFKLTLRDALASAAALVVVLGEDWHKLQDDASGARRLDNEDDWVREEIRTALKRGIPIFPLLLENAQLPRSEWLPKDIRAFVDCQGWTVRQAHVDPDLDALADAIAAQSGIARLGKPAGPGRLHEAAPAPLEAGPGPAARAPMVIAIEAADARLTDDELLPAERHLTVTLSAAQVQALGDLVGQLAQAASVDELIGLGTEAWEHLNTASPRLAGLFQRVAKAEADDRAPQPIAWTGRAALLAVLHPALLAACADPQQPLPFLSVQCGAHYFHPLAPPGAPPRRMQRREGAVRVATVEPGPAEAQALPLLADALRHEALLVTAEDAGVAVAHLAELLPRQPAAATRAVLAFGPARVGAAEVLAALAVLPCVSFAGPGAAQREVALKAQRALPQALSQQPVPVVMARLRRAAARPLLETGAADALRQVLVWSTWSWIGRPLFASGFGEVRKAASPHLMDLRDVASGDWYFERTEGIPTPYKTETLTAREAKGGFHLYVSGAGGTGKSCFLRFVHDKLEVNQNRVLPVWYKVHAPSSDWDELDAQIKAEVRAALARRLKTTDHGLLKPSDDGKDLWNFLLDLLARLREQRRSIDQIALFIDQLERTFESGDSPELRRLTAIAGKIGALLKGLGTDGGVRVFIASRKQYLADFLRSYQDAADINLHFVVLQTLPVKIEGAGFVERIVAWCNRNGLTPRRLAIDDEAKQLLAVSEDGHPLNMMLALIRLLSQADLPEEIDRATLEQRRPWQQRFLLDEALMGKDELDWYFFLAMAHARTEVVRREEVLWRLGLVNRDLARRARELGPNGVLERLWLLGHLGRTIHPRRRGEDLARFLEFFHANLRDHLVTHVMNRAEDAAGAPAVQRRRGMPPAWRALDRLREVARDWQQLQQALLREDIAVLMDHKEAFCEPIAVPMGGGTKEVESFYLMFMRDVGDRRDALFQAAKECVAYSAVVHDVLGRWAFQKLFPVVATPPGADANADEATQVGCCRRWLRPGRADALSRVRILQTLVELRDAHANRLLADLAFDPADDGDETWQVLADILADPLVASTHRSAFIAAALQRLLDSGTPLAGSHPRTERLGAFLVATCGGDAHALSHLLETLVEEVALLGDARLAGALRDLGEPERLQRWLADAGSTFAPLGGAARQRADRAPPALELRVGAALSTLVDAATLQLWSGALAARLGVPLPVLELPPPHAEVSSHRRSGEPAAPAGGHELELHLHGRLVALGRFYPGRVRTLTRDWGGEAAPDAIACFDEGAWEPVRWVEPARLDELGWRHPRQGFDNSVIDWLQQLLRRHVAGVFGPDDLIGHLRDVAQRAGSIRVPMRQLQALANLQRAAHLVFARLVRERAPLAERNVDLLMRLLELAQEGDTLDVALALPRLREHVRDDLCRGFADEANRLSVLLLEPTDEAWLTSRVQVTRAGLQRRLQLAPQEALRLAAAMRERFEEVARADHAAPVIVCEDHLRAPLFDVLQGFDPRLFVLSFSELSPEVRLTSRGLVRRFAPAAGG
ncbi:MAG TPA: FHIPEP family type III secretion protein [Falsiroseomonas sp.]|jgi:hypothetical protein|nr:FHIPEP family type III secretion protein [Falsiroseomonas sp.]